MNWGSIYSDRYLQVFLVCKYVTYPRSVILGVSFIASPSTRASLHGKPAYAEKYRDTCRA